MSVDRGFVDWRPQARTRAKIEAVEQILADYADHLPMTVRQVFYVLVGKRLVDKTNAEYRALGYLLRKARRARLIDFQSIHDQGSTLPYAMTGWTDERGLGRLVSSVVGNFDLDPQLGQERRLVVWCEAAGMLAQLERVCGPYGVQAVSGGGFDSVSDKWGFAQLVRRAGADFDVLHIGDLDQHGESIFRGPGRGRATATNMSSSTRLAITEEQIDEFALPVVPPEMTGGRLVVQAEALPPDVLAEIVDAAIRERLDLDLFDAVPERSAAIRSDFEAKLRAAGLWGQP